MIFDTSYPFLTGVFFSGVFIYHYRNSIVSNVAWTFFKTQANVQIMFKNKLPNKSDHSFLVTLKDGKLLDKNKSYDLMIYGKFIKDSNMYNYYLYNEINNLYSELPPESNNLYSETPPVNYKFISCEINYKSQIYVVKLNSCEQNFYFEKNIILSKSFVYWYLNKFYNIECNDSYSINIIDNNILEVSLTSENNNKGISLDKESYLIL